MGRLGKIAVWCLYSERRGRDGVCGRLRGFPWERDAGKRGGCDQKGRRTAGES